MKKLHDHEDEAWDSEEGVHCVAQVKWIEEEEEEGVTKGGSPDGIHQQNVDVVDGEGEEDEEGNCWSWDTDNTSVGGEDGWGNGRGEFYIFLFKSKNYI